MKWFSLKEVSRSLVTDLQTSVSQKSRIKLSIDIQLPDTLGGDDSLLLETVTWLTRWLDSRLINGVIIIDLSKKSQINDDVVLTAQITGLGTKARHTADLFQAARQFAYMQNRDVRVKEEDDRLIFEFNAELKAFEAQIVEAPPLLHKSILVAEDSEINALVFSGFMEGWGCEIVIAENGLDALEMASRKNFDLILMDIHMPVMGGNEAILAIRKFNKDIPIIALTASTLEFDIKQSLDNGANDYILKPVASKTLFSVLQKYLVPNRDTDYVQSIT
jgi:CheY-like chemotaxis protein